MKALTPKIRGEVWELGDGRQVTFLRRKKKDVCEVLTQRLFLEVHYVREFRKRLAPPMPETVDGVGSLGRR